jgi:hypothetical protein
MGFKVYYGDATDWLLKAAGCEKQSFIAAIDNPYCQSPSN